jgi:RNA polymerase sigma-70 factor (ECF subfamily)
MDGASDSELMQLARDGDRNAFGELVRRHQKRIFRLTVHILRNPFEAEDVTQETFVRAYQALQRFEGNSQPYTWLYRIAVNLSLNILRTRKARQQTVGDDDPRVEAWMAQRAPDNTGDPSNALEQRRLALALTAGIDQLSETLRTTLVVVCVEGLAHGDAAQVLGCPEGTVAWRIHEARRRLREHLASHGFDPTAETEP